MKIIRTITEKDFNRIATPDEWGDYSIRQGARAILTNDENQVALMYVAGDNYYKLPGGGVDEGEDFNAALKRELLEEVGATDIQIISELGQINEYRDEWNKKSEHYCYIVKLIGEIIEPARTEKEITEGYETVWAKDIADALRLVESGSPKEYGHDFERLREITFLRTVISSSK